MFYGIIMTSDTSLKTYIKEFNAEIEIIHDQEYLKLSAQFYEDIDSIYSLLELELNLSCVLLIYEDNDLEISDVLQFLRDKSSGIYHIEDYVWYCITHSHSNLTIKMIENTIHILGREELQTLVTYLHEGGNTSKTAKKLYIHRNTMDYRINKLNEAFKMDLRNNTTFLILSFLTSKNDLCMSLY